MFWLLKSTSTLCCSENSLQNPLAAATTPRYSSFDECNRWDIAWTSAPILFGYVLAQITGVAADFDERLGRILCQLFEFDCQQCQTLVDVVVEFSRNSSTLLFLRVNKFCDSHRRGPPLRACARSHQERSQYSRAKEPSALNLGTPMSTIHRYSPS